MLAVKTAFFTLLKLYHFQNENRTTESTVLMKQGFIEVRNFEYDLDGDLLVEKHSHSVHNIFRQ